jgi:Glycosyl transferase family 2
MPSIGVVIPCINARSYLERHQDSLAPWLDLAAQVVVVDSQSTDGTMEFLKERLRHPASVFLQHPPGLYQSWNFGIKNISAKYVYMATVGDSITRQGLEHLLAVAEEFQSDVVISKPRFIDDAGQPLPDNRWLIDEILDGLNILRPRLLSTTEQFLFTVTNLWGAILGSSASNIYRAETLQQRPFPTEFGTAGDGAWGVQNMFDVKIAVTPERFSTFRDHPKAYSLAQYQVESLAMKLFRLTQRVIAGQQPGRPALPQILEAVNWAELEPALNQATIAQENMERLRRQPTPAILQPAAWQARLARGRARRKINEITGRFLAQGRAKPGEFRR